MIYVPDDTTDSYKYKPITTFDISNNLRLLAAGTELYGSESFILFWDFRAKSLLGGYWETHTDDITQVRYKVSLRYNLLNEFLWRILGAIS